MVEYSASIMSSAFAGAIVKAQSEIETAKKDVKNDFFKSFYSNLTGVWDACRTALHSNGIAVLQFPRKSDTGFICLYTALVYGPTGEVFGDEFQVPVKDPSNPQAVGSAMTYARRYALAAVVGVCTEDDDGNAAAKAPAQSKAREQAERPERFAQVTAAASEAGASHYLTKFNLAGLQTGRDGMKQVYSEVKASTLAEPAKTALLAKMATTIKETK